MLDEARPLLNVPAETVVDTLTPEMLCARYAERVCRFAALLAKEDAEAEDIAQETLLRAIAKLGQFDPRRGAPEAWLLGIAANVARDSQPRARSLWNVLGRLSSREPAPRDVEAEVLDRLDTETLLRAVRDLAPRDRQLIALRFGADLPTSTVAKLVGLGPESAGRAIRRALDRLRDRLKGELR